MKHVEFEAMRELTRTETKVYLHLRHHMDYATGIVGAVRKISYQSIHEYIEEVPPRGSKDPVYKPSKQQINRVLRKLESAGVIERLHSGKPNEHMVFRLVLASTDLNRLNEERHMSDTRAATQGATRRNPVNTQPRAMNTDTMSDKGATPHERHTSVTSDIEQREIAREADFDAPSGRDLAFDKSFEAIAFRRYGNNKHLIENEFESFRLHKSHRTTRRSTPDWQDEWRRWIARSNIMNPTPTTQRGNSHAATQHHTAAVLDVCEKYTAGQQPITDYDDTHD